MRRPAVLRSARLGLLVAAIVCTFGCRQEGDLAAAGGKEANPAPVEENAVKEDAVEEAPVEEDAVAEVPVQGAPVEKHPVDENRIAKNPTEKNPLAGCQQCHVDVEDEYAVSGHFKEKIACTDCHGRSEGHLADENNEVKPDEVFARKDVDRLCGECHECSRPTAAESPADRSKVCTDCHGAHDLAPVKP